MSANSITRMPIGLLRQCEPLHYSPCCLEPAVWEGRDVADTPARWIVSVLEPATGRQYSQLGAATPRFTTLHEVMQWIFTQLYPITEARRTQWAAQPEPRYYLEHRLEIRARQRQLAARLV